YQERGDHDHRDSAHAHLVETEAELRAHRPSPVAGDEPADGDSCELADETQRVEYAVAARSGESSLFAAGRRHIETSLRRRVAHRYRGTLRRRTVGRHGRTFIVGTPALTDALPARRSRTRPPPPDSVARASGRHSARA